MDNLHCQVEQKTTFQKRSVFLSDDEKPSIFIFSDYFSPGFKAGGPIRSCVNFAEHMKQDYAIYVLTSDRDLGDTTSYETIIANRWINKKDGVYIYYASPHSLNWKNIQRLIKTVAPDYIYLNSMYSKYFTVYPLLMKYMGRVKSKTILAPRGMLKESAVSFKPFKKKLFLWLFNLLRFQKYVHFHATDVTEENDIKKYFGNEVSVANISNFPGFQKAFVKPIRKTPGELKMIFVGRVHPIKNLHYLLQCLQMIKSTVELTIVAAIEYITYWKMCLQMADSLPENIKVRWIEGIPYQQLETMLENYHLFCLPTQGENFGHAIFEALLAGRPVLISDQTPWRDLAIYKAGWDISLSTPSAFINIIETVAAMDATELNEWCKAAWQYCHDYIKQSDIKEQYRQLFN